MSTNTELIAKALPVAKAIQTSGAKAIVRELIVALEAAEAELTRRDTVAVDGNEAQETSEVEVVARLMIVNAGWDPDEPEDDTEEDIKHIYVEAAEYVEAARMARAAAPVSLEAVKAEAWDEGNEACRAVYVEGRKSGPVVNPYRKLEEANRG